MILKTKVPGRVVQRRIKKPGRGYRIVPWFRFDKNGYKEIDETKLTNADIVKLKSLFEVVDSIEKLEDTDKEYNDTKEKELVEVAAETEIREQAKELGIKSWHVKSIERLIKEIKDMEV